jgi:hypothetical protein
VLSVESVPLPVLDLDDVVVSKLAALDEHALDLAGPLLIARALREQIDWGEVRRRTAGSPYAHGFLAMLEARGVVDPPAASPAAPTSSRVRVVEQG